MRAHLRAARERAQDPAAVLVDVGARQQPLQPLHNPRLRRRRGRCSCCALFLGLVAAGQCAVLTVYLWSLRPVTAGSDGVASSADVPAPPHSPPPPSPPAAAASDGAAPALRVPMILHQSWRDDGFPKDMFNFRWQEQILALNPGWQLMRWTDASQRELIATSYPWFLAAYDAYPSYIQRCDAARYFAAHKYGGVYADLDVECSKPFAPAIGDARAVFSFKQGTNMSRGLVNAIFASEAGHPLWEIVFELLRNRSAAGAAAASHVDVIQSTGPALLRAAVLQLDETGRLGPLGVKLLDSSVWHPTMPEQKHGRDTSEATKAMIDASSCVHHFVSSWMTHDKQAHTSTLEERKVAGTPVVPKAQSFRTTNEWRSFELEKSAAKGRGGHNGRGRGRAAARAPTAADYAAAAAAPRRDPSAAAAAPRYDTSAFAADKSRKAKEARGGDAGRMIFGDAEGADEDV